MIQHVLKWIQHTHVTIVSTVYSDEFACKVSRLQPQNTSGRFFELLPWNFPLSLCNPAHHHGRRIATFCWALQDDLRWIQLYPQDPHLRPTHFTPKMKQMTAWASKACNFVDKNLSVCSPSCMLLHFWRLRKKCL